MDKSVNHGVYHQQLEDLRVLKRLADNEGRSKTEAVYEFAYRLGFEAAREAAAKACEAADEHAYPWACAAMIRSIPLPGGEK